MEAAIRILNGLERSGVIGRYAVGGGMAAFFYIEPFLTYDLDVFVRLPCTGAGLVTLAPVYDALRARGYPVEREAVIVEGVPVQFLPPSGRLVEEAIDAARVTTLGTTPVRVLRAEHLAAIMLQTGRDKDRERLAAFVRQAPLDEAALGAILERHALDARWREWGYGR